MPNRPASMHRRMGLDYSSSSSSSSSESSSSSSSSSSTSSSSTSISAPQSGQRITARSSVKIFAGRDPCRLATATDQRIIYREPESQSIDEDKLRYRTEDH